MGQTFDGFAPTGAKMNLSTDYPIPQAQDILISPSGHKLYVLNYSWLYQFTLGVPFSIESVKLDGRYPLYTHMPWSLGLDISSDGKKMIICGKDGNNNSQLVQYILSDAFDVLTADFDLKFSSREKTAVDVSFNQDGTRLLVLDGFTDLQDFSGKNLINEYSLQSPYDINTIVFLRRGLEIDAPYTYISAMGFSNNGTSLHLVQLQNSYNTRNDRHFKLSSPYVTKNAELIAGTPSLTNDVVSFALSLNDSKLLFLIYDPYGSDKIREYENISPQISISNTSQSHNINEIDSVSPFSTMNLYYRGTDLLSATIRLSKYEHGVLSGNELQGTGPYTTSNLSKDDLSSLLRSLKFKPTEGLATPGDSIVTNFTIEITNGEAVAIDSSTSVCAYIEPPIITFENVHYEIAEGDSTLLFSTVEIKDSDQDSLSATIRMTDYANGTLTAEGLHGTGPYTTEKSSIAEINALLSRIKFLPAQNLAQSDRPVTTEFTIRVTDGQHFVKNTVSKITAYLPGPTIVLKQDTFMTIEETETTELFSNISVKYFGNEPLSAKITLSENGNGSLTGDDLLRDEPYRIKATNLEDLQNSLRSVIFHPTEGLARFDSPVQTLITIEITDGESSAVESSRIQVKVLPKTVVSSIENATKTGKFVRPVSSIRNFYFLQDGVKLVVIVDNILYQFSLSDPYNVERTSIDGKIEMINPQSIDFNDDGSVLYVVGQKNLYQYDLATPYNVLSCSAEYTEISFGDEVGYATDVKLYNNGSFMSIADRNFDQISKYQLSTSYDITTATYLNKTIELRHGILNFRFVQDGYFLYTVSENSKYQIYELKQPFETENAKLLKSGVFPVGYVTALAFLPNLNNFYLSHSIGNENRISEYEISKVPMIKSENQLYSINEKNSVSPFSLTKIRDEDSDYLSAKIVLSDSPNGTLSGPGLIGSGPYTTDTLYLYDLETLLQSIVFKPTDGLAQSKNPVSTDIILEISDGRKVATETITIITKTDPEIQSISSVNDTPTDGQIAFEIHFDESVQNVDLSDFILETSGDLSGEMESITGSDRLYEVSVSVSNDKGALFLRLDETNNDITDLEGNPVIKGFTGEAYINYTIDLRDAKYAGELGEALDLKGLKVRATAFDDDGDQIFATSIRGRMLFSYNLRAPFDIQSIDAESKVVYTFPNNLNLTPKSFKFIDDGNMLQVMEVSGDFHVFQLSSSYDISTLSHEYRAQVATSYPKDFSFNDDGTKLILLQDQTSLEEYTLSTPFDLRTVTSVADPISLNSIYGDKIIGASMLFDATGLYLFVVEQNRIIKFELLTPFDIQTISYSGDKARLPLKDIVETTSRYMTFNDDESKFFILGYREIHEFYLTNAPVFVRHDSTSLTLYNEQDSVNLFSRTNIYDLDQDSIAITISLQDPLAGQLVGAGLTGSGPYELRLLSEDSLNSVLQSLWFKPTIGRLTESTKDTVTFRLDVTDGNHFTIDTTLTVIIDLPPKLLSIRVDGTPDTSATEIHYLLTFSEAVENVDLTDFELITSQYVDAELSAISGTGAEYLLNLTEIIGDGELSVSLKETNDIVDNYGYALSAHPEGELHNVKNSTAFPEISGTISNQNVHDEAISYPFRDIIITCQEDVAIEVEMDSYEYGVLIGDNINGSGDDSGSGPYTISTTNSQTAQEILRNVRFEPIKGEISNGNVQEITVSIKATSGPFDVQDSTTNLILNSAPYVEHISIHSFPDSTNSILQFGVTFNEEVFGVSLSDFTIDASSNVMADLIKMEGAGKDYIISVSNISGDGIVSLDFLSESQTSFILDIHSNQAKHEFTEGADYNTGRAFEISEFAKIEKVKRRINDLARSFVFINDGEEMITLSNYDEVREKNKAILKKYNLSTPYDATTAYEIIERRVELSRPDEYGMDLLSNSDGSKIFISNGTSIIEYVSHSGLIADLERENSIWEESLGREMVFNNDGTKLFIFEPFSYSGYDNKNRLYNLAVPYDLSTAEFEEFIPFIAEEVIEDVKFNSDGTKFYVLSNANYNYSNAEVRQFALTSPYDVSSAELDTVMILNTTGCKFGNLSEMGFSKDGTFLNNLFYSNNKCDLGSAWFTAFYLKENDGAENGRIDDNPESEPLYAHDKMIPGTVTVYPNPAKCTLYLKNIQSIESVSLYNLAGVEEDMRWFGPDAIDVSHMKSGIYILQFMENGAYRSMRVVIGEE